MKKLTLSLLIALGLIGFSGCANSDVESYRNYDWKCKEVYGDNGNCIYVYELIDPDTGVHYLLYDGNKSGGLQVMYNEDGSIKSDK